MRVATVGKTRSSSIYLTNVSATGASLRAEGVAELGDEFFIRVEGLETFATVIWRRDGLCGVQFDEPLDADGVEHLRNEAEKATMTRLTPEELSALADWRNGMAR